MAGCIAGREEEHEVGGAEAFDGELGREHDSDAEGFEHVGGAASGGDGAIAVLGDFGPGSGGDQRGGGRDVEGERANASGAAGVDEGFALVGGEGNWRRGLAMASTKPASSRRSRRGWRGRRGGLRFRYREALTGQRERGLRGRQRRLLAGEGGTLFSDPFQYVFEMSY